MKPRRARSAPRVLLDTNVVSELARKAPEPKVVRRLQAFGRHEIFLSAVTVGELAYGVACVAPGRRRDELRHGLDDLKGAYARQILPFDTETAELWATIAAECRAKGLTLPVQDAQIAATALHHGLALVTRNTKDFAATGVPLIDPWLDK